MWPPGPVEPGPSPPHGADRVTAHRASASLRRTAPRGLRLAPACAGGRCAPQGGGPGSAGPGPQHPPHAGRDLRQRQGARSRSAVPGPRSAVPGPRSVTGHPAEIPAGSDIRETVPSLDAPALCTFSGKRAPPNVTVGLWRWRRGNRSATAQAVPLRPHQRKRSGSAKSVSRALHYSSWANGGERR